MSRKNPENPGKTPPSDDPRTERRAAALRANLKRRKAPGQAVRPGAATVAEQAADRDEE